MLAPFALNFLGVIGQCRGMPGETRIAKQL